MALIWAQQWTPWCHPCQLHGRQRTAPIPCCHGAARPAPHGQPRFLLPLRVPACSMEFLANLANALTPKQKLMIK